MQYDQRFRQLNATAYFTVIAVGSGHLFTDTPPIAGLSALLLIGFCGVQSRLPQAALRFPGGLPFLLAIQTAIGTGLMALHPPDSPYPILFFVTSATAMIFFPFRSALIGVLGWSLISLLYFGLTRGVVVGTFNALPYIGGFWFFGAFANTLHQANAAHADLRNYALHAEQLAVAEERNRMAREIHDTLGHFLTMSIVQLEAAQRLIPGQPERAGQIAATVQHEARTALSDLRRSVATLRTPLQEDLPLNEALPELIDQFTDAAGLPVHAGALPDLSDLPPIVRLTIYRTVQEALTNIQRHANATHVWLTLIRDPVPQAIHLTIDDDGVGLSKPVLASDHSYGLRGLRERAALLGGTCTVTNRSGGGVSVQLTIPLTEISPKGAYDHARPDPVADRGRSAADA